jgi:hypothetical protein
LSKIELYREGHIPIHLGRVEGSFECHGFSRDSLIGSLDRVKGSCDGYNFILLYFDVYTALYGPFFDLCPSFKGLRYLWPIYEVKTQPFFVCCIQSQHYFFVWVCFWEPTPVKTFVAYEHSQWAFLNFSKFNSKNLFLLI